MNIVFLPWLNHGETHHYLCQVLEIPYPHVLNPHQNPY